MTTTETTEPVVLSAVLRGRAAEQAAVDRLLDGARAGRSAALVVRGEAGIGKSALLTYATTRAAGDMLVLAQNAVETESELPYAGLHLLLRDVSPRIAELPAAQERALRVALGLATSERAPDRFLVGLAVLTLLGDLAADRPMVCVLDDAHWFDRASAEVLLFAARRLDAEAVVMLFAARTEHAPAFPAPGLPELALTRLDDASASEVLDADAGDLPRHVRELLLRNAAGNPLALHELPAAHRGGRAPVYPLGPPSDPDGTAPTHSAVEREFAARIAELPESVRTVLLVAAADGTCNTGVVLAAAQRLGATPTDLEIAENARLLMFTDGCLGFHHPLIRTAAYGSATLVRRHAAHRALAEVLDGQPDVDRRNWHRAASSMGPDEDVARALEHSARRARERGSHEAVAAAYERAAALSPDAARSAARLAAAAGAAADAGRREWAEALACAALEHTGDPAHRARIALVRARLASEANRPEETHRLLLDAVGPAAPVVPELVTEMLQWAVEAGWAARDRSAVERVVRTADELGVSSGHIRAHAALATAQLEDDPDAALPDAVAALAQVATCASQDAPRVTASLARWHLVVGDDAGAHALASAAERDSRAAGTLGVLPRVLAVLAASHWHLGRWHDARSAATEGLRIAQDTGQDQAVAELAIVLAHLAAAEGDEVGRADALVELDDRRRPPDHGPTVAASLALLDLGRGRFEAAADRLSEPATCPGLRRSLPDLVEAAARAGRLDEARCAAELFGRWAEHTGRTWARAVALRCRALVEADDAAGELFAEAVALHRVDGAHPFERARTELLQGEWLRRARRRSEARAPLRAAAEAFEELRARPWAERARAELRATGESRSAEPRPDVLADLTPQELQVVRLAAAGMTNRDIGAQLFLSPRTVGYHLYKAFPKLGVASRAQLVRLDLPA